MIPVGTRDNLNFDTKVLTEFLYALNILRRQVVTYPRAHPIILSSLDNLLKLNSKLLEFRQSLTISIARDTILIENQDVQPRDPVLKDLAQNLFEAKVASLTFQRDLQADGLCRFLEIVSEGAKARSGQSLEQRLSEAGVHGLMAREIDFAYFHKAEMSHIVAPKSRFAESETAVLWKSFAEGLSRGNLDPHGIKEESKVDLDPDLLAEVLNADSDDPDAASRFEASYEDAITEFLAKTDREQIRIQAHKEALGRLGHLIEKLNPELRLRFINSTLKACAHHNVLAEELLTRMPHSAILTALEQADAKVLDIPQPLLDILGKLAMSRGQFDSTSRVVGDVQRSHDYSFDQLRKIFEVDHVEEFVAKDYQDALNVLAIADVPTDLSQGEVESLTKTIDGYIVEHQFCNVLLELLGCGDDSQGKTGILRNIEEMVDYFINTGDFPMLLQILARSKNQLENDVCRDTGNFAEEVRAIFADRNFINKFLDGLVRWDKSVYPEIIAVVRAIGNPMADPLLDRLAEEELLSMRHLLMNCLMALGSDAREAMLERLHDSRWYFLRNLIVLLTQLEDPEILRPLRPLVRHHHPKVRFEALAAFVKYGDTRINRYLLDELDKRNPLELQTVIRLAAKSKDPQVIDKLAQLLNARLPFEHEANLRATIIQSLAEVGLEAALPELRKFLLNRHLMPFVKSVPLKKAALQSLLRYDSPASLDLAREVARATAGEIARTATAVAFDLGKRRMS